MGVFQQLHCPYLFRDKNCSQTVTQDGVTDGVIGNPHPTEIWVRMDHDTDITAEFKACEHCQADDISTTKFIMGTGGTRFTMQNRNNVEPPIYGRFSVRDLPTYDDWACYTFVDKKLFDALVSWRDERNAAAQNDPSILIANPHYLDYIPLINDIGINTRKSHKAGLSADIRYFNKSGEGFIFNGNNNIDDFDKLNTDALIAKLASQGTVQAIMVSAYYPDPLPSGATKDIKKLEHENHFHMGYKDPD